MLIIIHDRYRNVHRRQNSAVLVTTQQPFAASDHLVMRINVAYARAHP